MAPRAGRPRSLADENERLRARLEELEETLRAIRSGEVDALVVERAGEDQVFSLKSADQTYRLMVEQMPKGAATLSDGGVLLYCNPFLGALLGVPVEALLGAPLAAFLDEASAACVHSLLRAGGGGQAEITLLKGNSGAPTHVSLSVTPLPLEGARVFCMIVTDLTHRRRQEHQRAQLEHEQMARSAAERETRAAQEEIERRKEIEAALRLAEEQRTELLESERIARTGAEEANRLKDEFLATLSHELRSPLNAIVAWSHVLCDPALDSDTARRAVEAIDRNARAQTQLVADLLDVSRIVTGKFHLSLGPVRLSEVVEAAAETVQLAAQARGIRLELTLDPAVGPVTGDAGRLQQVVWNLLSNATKFAATGGLVQVRLQAADPCLELSVTDDGPGIDPEFLPYVFDRFRQADSSSTRRHAGLGLGLAIVRHLVELHGGTVEARNRDDRSGAVLTVRLPRHRAVPSAATAERAVLDRAPGEAAPPAPSLAGVGVLVVDDEQDTREALAVGLGRHGARVVAVGSASEALAALVRERPQVLVADIGMPGEDGYALIQKVRALPADGGGATPAIALTGYANLQDRVDTLRAGFQMHVSKPATPAELAAAVAAVMQPPQRGTRLATPKPERRGES